ncbi:MAG TPA: hypothetical protein VMU15_21310 [Anaeromyxobacter sp.]|nr:hypothetical protein [Anaeromyxobacter sp.]
MHARPLAAALCAVLAAGGQAQERPSEDELFGPPPAAAAEPRPASPPAAAAGEHGQTEAELFGAQKPPEQARAPDGALLPRVREDWLKVGGLLQLQAQASAYQDTRPHDWPLSSPNLLDVYLDSRPNDRVRGFVLGRLNYDPTVRSSGGATQGSTGTSTIGFGTSSTQNPGGVLDQLWVNFDLDHRAFVTAGRQHVKWGVGKFWNPTDYLHPVKRDPLATFDVRTGTTMVKVHVPWEKRGWNFYAVTLLEDASGDQTRTVSRLGRVGCGGRAELVLGGAELGLDGLAQDGHHPRWGVDLSAGVGPFDLYGEAALRTDTDGPLWRRSSPPLPPPAPYPELQNWVRDDRRGILPQIVAGGTWSVKYSDEDSLTVGAEYFYNGAGYDHPDVYPYLLTGAPVFPPPIVNGQPVLVQQDPTAFRPFYLGKHYAAVNLYLPKPGSWNDTTIVATVLGNLSDRSYVARIDSSVLALTYLTVETFVAVHFGRMGGEFRLALPADIAAQASAESGGSTFPTGAPIVDVGIALRVSL